MTKGKPDISDWIQYLISERTVCNTHMAWYFSVAIGIFSITMAVKVVSNTEIILEFIIPILIVFIFVCLGSLSAHLSFCITDILRDIMEENITDINELKEEWLKCYGKIGKKKGRLPP